MLTNFNQTLTVNAVSAVTTSSGETKTIAYLSASIRNPGEFNVNRSVPNMDDLEENLETATTDFNEFQEKVLQISRQYREAESYGLKN